MGIVKGKTKKAGLFSKDKETLPFFSIHPKTRIGTALRIAFVAFFIISIIITILGNNGLVFCKYWDLYYLNYIVPISIILLLIMLALGKRIPNSILSIGIPVLLIFLLYTVIRTISVMMAYSCELSYSPEIRISCKTENVNTDIALMRQCKAASEDELNPGDDSAEQDNPEGTFLIQREKRLYTAHWSDGIIGTVEGEINVPYDEESLPVLGSSNYLPQIEWLDENTARIFIEGDTELACGEIKIHLDGTDENAIYKPDALMNESQMFESPNGYTVQLYFQDYKYVSLYETTFESFLRVYNAYPLKARLFLDTNVRTEGELTVYPYHSISDSDLMYEEISPDVIKISLNEEFKGGSGSVLIYLNEKKAETTDENADSSAESTAD